MASGRLFCTGLANNINNSYTLDMQKYKIQPLRRILIMRLARKLSILLFALIVSMSTLALAEVEKGDSRTLKLDAKPIDVAVTADGKYTFILAEGGKIFIMDSSGSITDSLDVSKSVVSIGTTPGGELLLLADSKANTIEMVRISFVMDIDISGLPFKGAADAPVVVAMFSDYQ
jgi:hypothetical protein